MRRVIVAIATLVMALSMVLIVLTITGPRDTFTGSRVKNPECYTLDFDYMSQEDSHTIEMEKDEELFVEYAIEKGTVDLEITEGNCSLVYRGNRLDKAQFTLVASESGDFQISVKAKRAQGYVHITKKSITHCI